MLKLGLYAFLHYLRITMCSWAFISWNTVLPLSLNDNRTKMNKKRFGYLLCTFSKLMLIKLLHLQMLCTANAWIRCHLLLFPTDLILHRIVPNVERRAKIHTFCCAGCTAKYMSDKHSRSMHVTTGTTSVLMWVGKYIMSVVITYCIPMILLSQQPSIKCW